VRVLMIADRGFAKRESRMLTRLEVALADEGVRVARASPEGMSPEHSASLAPLVEYEPPAPLLTLRSRAARLLTRLAAVSPDWTRAAVDLVHVWGEGAWPLAASVARQAGAALVVEMWSHALLPKTRAYERRVSRHTRFTWIAPGDLTAESLRQAGARERGRVAPWGAHARDTPSAFSDPIRPVSASVLSTGRDPGAVSAALEGLALATRRHEELMIFLDAAATNRSHEVWKRLRTLGALERVSLMPDLEARREAALRADLFVRPEPSSEHRSVVIDAMAAGMCVVSRQDPVVEALQHDQNCLICHEPTALGWEHTLLAALDEPQRARAIGSAAQKWVRSQQSVSGQAAVLLDAYEDARAAETAATA